jgi:hypothetical protein
MLSARCWWSCEPIVSAVRYTIIIGVPVDKIRATVAVGVDRDDTDRLAWLIASHATLVHIIESVPVRVLTGGGSKLVG